jgi:hypothetical protein
MFYRYISVSSDSCDLFTVLSDRGPDEIAATPNGRKSSASTVRPRVGSGALKVTILISQLLSVLCLTVEFAILNLRLR